jgi:hypothetical protein
MASFLTDPVPHSEGASFIRSKPAVTRAMFDALAPELQAKAFVITGVEVLDVVARVRDLTARLPEGGDYEELKSEILAELTPFFVKSTDPEEQAKEEAAARRRAELLLRMHGWQAYARTNRAMLLGQINVFPYCEYIDSGDGRVRHTHHALNGKIIPTNHPFWLTHTPPWEFGCRCDCVGRTQEEIDELMDAEKDLPLEERRILNDYQLQQLATGLIYTRGKNGTLGWLDIRTPYERTGEGYQWRVDEDPLSIDQILGRYTPDERQAFEDFASKQKLDDGRTLLDWWQPKPGAAAAPVVPATPPPAPVPAPAAIAPAVAAEPPLPAAPDSPVDLPSTPVIATTLTTAAIAEAFAAMLKAHPSASITLTEFTLRARTLAAANGVPLETAIGWLRSIGDKPKLLPDGRAELPAKKGESSIAIIWPKF